MSKYLPIILSFMLVFFVTACESETDVYEDDFAADTSAVDTSTAMLGGMAAQPDFASWDADQDSSLTEQELSEGLSQENVFSQWDTDADGNLSAEEFNTAATDMNLSADAAGSDLLAQFDSDADSMISEEEFAAALHQEWDADQSGSIEETEFDDAIAQVEIFQNDGADNMTNPDFGSTTPGMGTEGAGEDEAYNTTPNTGTGETERDGTTSEL